LVLGLFFFIFDENAASWVNKSIEIDASYTEVYLERGKAKRLLNHYPGSIADYTKAIEIAPENADAFHNRGLSKIESGEKERGCRHLNTVNQLGFAKKKIKKYRL
jgi:hypothetical protein